MEGLHGCTHSIEVIEMEDKGPVWFIAVVLAVIATLGAGHFVFGWFSNASDTAMQQYSASAMLNKYEWFKDASAQLDAKQANIEVYKNRQRGLEQSYGNKPRSQWAREDRDQYNLQSDEIAGTVASYNQLAAEYNAQMAKFNWRFANAGALPAGADRPLPREYRPYVNE